MERSIAYMKANLFSQLTVNDVAQHLGYSGSRLRAIFKKATGESIYAYLLRLRLQKAKELLSNTELSILEIAMDVGFASYTRFADLFRTKCGTSPTAFRRSFKLMGEAQPSSAQSNFQGQKREWLRDNFLGTNLAAWWTPIEGGWIQAEGCAQGSSPEAAFLLLNRPLPENFTISLTVRVGQKGLPHLILLLCSDSLEHRYCTCTLGAHGNITGEFVNENGDHRWNPAGVLHPGSSCTILFELRDDAAIITIDGQELFSSRDAFPPHYSMRSHFAVGTWHSSIQIQDFVVMNNGFIPLIRTVRQGDSLYTNKLYDRARDFYLRLLEATDSFDETVELRFKVAMCYLMEGHYVQARLWLEKVSALPTDNFWAQQAKIAQLQVDCEQGLFDEFLANTRFLFAHPGLRGRIRDLLEHAAGEIAGRGFHDRCISIWNHLVEFETPQTHFAQEAHLQLANALQTRCRFAEAEKELEYLLLSPAQSREIMTRAKRELVHVYAIQGKLIESDRINRDLRDSVDDPELLAGCDIYRAINLRARGRFTECLKILQEVLARYKNLQAMGRFAELLSAGLLCTTGRANEAAKIIERMVPAPSKPLAPGIPFALHLFGACDYSKLGEILLQAARQTGPALADCANAGVQAGIFFELGGNPGKAKETWEEMTRRFPPSRCCYYARLAEALLGGKAEVLYEMPYPAQDRSEMFLLSGLLWEKRGHKEQSRSFLQRSINEDPTMAWPAHFAKQYLAEPKGKESTL